PLRLKNHREIVGFSACLIIGVWFSLAKTVPGVHALTVAAWEATIGGPVSQRLDPTDLCALPMLWFGWQIWQRAKPIAIKRSSIVPVVFGLAVFATLASDDGPTNYYYTDAGITSICSQGENLAIYLPDGGDYEIVNLDSTYPVSTYKLTTRTAVYISSDG